MTTTVRVSTPPISRRLARVLGSVGDYVALTKPRIVELLLVTTVPTMMLAAHGLPGFGLVLVTVAGGSLAAGSANALNCYLDRDIDAIMLRTRARPLNRSAVSPRAALVFGVVLGVASIGLLWRETNPLSAELAAGAIGFYVVVYTGILKRRTSSNIVWGGAAGCMPVLIGWSTVTDRVSWSAAVLFLVIFLWTPPHFWALAMRYRSDYAAAGVPMLPVVATPQQVAVRIVAHSWAMVAASLALWPIARTTLLYPTVAAVAGGLFLRAAHDLYRRVRRGEDPRPMVLFHWSITYLSVLFVGIAGDALLGHLR